MGKVITYKNEGVERKFAQIKLDSGQRVLISITANQIKIYKLYLRGMLPIGIVWMHPD